MCGYVHISASTCGSQRCWIPLKLECQAVAALPSESFPQLLTQLLLMNTLHVQGSAIKTRH